MKKAISTAVVLVILAIACVFVFRGGEKPGAPETGTTGETEAGKTAVAEKPSNPSRPSRKQAQTPRPKPPKPVLDIADDDDDDDDDDDEVKKTPEEKALAKRIEKSLDDENLEAALACAKEALNCKNAEIRQAMVDTLGWFGEKALPELTPFLADPDDDVRESAMNEWSMAVSGIEDDAEKIGTVELAMQVLTGEDELDDISGEYIGVDEKLAVESLLRIIEAGGSKQGVAKAKETYEFVTGDEFVDRATAEKWIAEEYEPPEEDDPPDSREPASTR